MAYSIKNIIMLTLSMVIIGLVLPLGLGYVAGIDLTVVTINGTAYSLTDLVDPSVLTLIQVVLPIVAVVGIILGFLYFGKKS